MAKRMFSSKDFYIFVILLLNWSALQLKAQSLLSNTENAVCLDDDDTVVFVSNETLSFEEANIFCQTKFISPGTLARISTPEDLFLIGNLTFGVDTYVGIRANSGEGQGNTSNFFYLDGEEKDLDFIHVDSGVFPWSSFSNNGSTFALEPNNFQNIEDCVEIRFFNGRLNDVPCDFVSPFVCRFSSNKIKKFCNRNFEFEEKEEKGKVRLADLVDLVFIFMIVFSFVLIILTICLIIVTKKLKTTRKNIRIN